MNKDYRRGITWAIRWLRWRADRITDPTIKRSYKIAASNMAGDARYIARCLRQQRKLSRE